MIKKLLLFTIWLIIIPFIMGKVFVKENNPKKLYRWTLGIVFEMAIFFVIAIPMVLLKKTFSFLVMIYTISIVCVTLICLTVEIFKIRTHKKNIINDFFKNLKEDLKNMLKGISVIQLIAILIIAGQVYEKIAYANINNDDVSFVGLSVKMIETDSMYLNANGKLISRRALAPISAFYSTFAILLDTHVTIVTHTVMPVVFLIMAYVVYYEFAIKLFKNNDKDTVYIFLILLAILNVFAFDIKGANRYLLLYTWFGRSLLAGIFLPLIWAISFDAMDKSSNNIKDWGIICVTVLAGLLGSQMGIVLLPIPVTVLGFVNSVRERKLSYLVKSLICIIPSLIIGLLYIKIK